MFFVKIYVTLIAILILLMIAFIFGSQNNQIITLNYFIARTDITIAAAVSLFTVIGIITGLFFALLLQLMRAVKPKSARTNTQG